MLKPLKALLMARVWTQRVQYILLQKESYIFVIYDALTTYVITKSNPEQDAETAADVLSMIWIFIFGPPKNCCKI